MTRRPVHIIGVPLDLGQGRRGVDMGPSALRIAGLDERIAALGHTVVDQGDLHVPIPETRSPGDPTKKYIREIARVCQRLYQAALGSLQGRRAAARARRRPQPRRRVGGRGGGLGAAARAADRPALGRRARRHEHAGVLDERQRARHAAGGAARPRAAELARIAAASPKVLPSTPS